MYTRRPRSNGRCKRRRSSPSASTRGKCCLVKVRLITPTRQRPACWLGLPSGPSRGESLAAKLPMRGPSTCSPSPPPLTTQAVLLDCCKQFGPLPAELLQAHGKSPRITPLYYSHSLAIVSTATWTLRSCRRWDARDLSRVR
eukprot:scaffold95370_cov61-Phaeocystis_antarctica.AAC.7